MPKKEISQEMKLRVTHNSIEVKWTTPNTLSVFCILHSKKYGQSKIKCSNVSNSSPPFRLKVCCTPISTLPHTEWNSNAQNYLYNTFPLSFQTFFKKMKFWKVFFSWFVFWNLQKQIIATIPIWDYNYFFVSDIFHMVMVLMPISV